MATIVDVARLAGVSPATVSRLLNKNGAVAPETADKIWKAVRETDYSVNETARSLRLKNKSGKVEKQAIDCMFARSIDSFIDPFFLELIHVIEPEIFNYDYRLRYQYVGSDVPSLLISADNKKNSVFILGRVDNARLTMLKNFYHNLVYVGLQDLDIDIDRIICSGYEASAKAVDYLISLGHRKICYLGETNNEQRYMAYMDVINNNKAIGCTEHTINVEFSPSDSYSKVKAEIKKGADFTAIFCANDISAFGVLQALKECKLSVPRDISVIGLNDVESVRYLDPMLTTVKVPIEEMGKQAAHIMIDRIEGRHRLPTKIILPYQLVERETCMPPRK